MTIADVHHAVTPKEWQRAGGAKQYVHLFGYNRIRVTHAPQERTGDRSFNVTAMRVILGVYV